MHNAVKRGLTSHMESLMGGYKRKKHSERLKRSDPYLRKIYSQVVEYNAKETKIKPEKIKVSRHQINDFLRKRFGPRTSQKILNYFNFP